MIFGYLDAQPAVVMDTASNLISAFIDRNLFIVNEGVLLKSRLCFLTMNTSSNVLRICIAELPQLTHRWSRGAA